MAALNFTVFTDQILSGEKQQTIRPLRKVPIKPRDRLYLYGTREFTVRAHTRERFESKLQPYNPQIIKVKSYTRRIKYKLGEAVCSEVVPIELGRFETEDDKFLGILALGDWHIDEICLDLDKDKFAQDDGFKNFREMELFFITTYKLKPGDSLEMVIIKWREFQPAGEK